MNVEMPMQVVWGLVGYILITTWGFIWWAATTTQQLKTLKEMVDGLSSLNGLFAKKEDIARELGVIENNQDRMWEKIDKLKEKVDGQKST